MVRSGSEFHSNATLMSDSCSRRSRWRLGAGGGAMCQGTPLASGVAGTAAIRPGGDIMPSSSSRGGTAGEAFGVTQDELEILHASASGDCPAGSPMDVLPMGRVSAALGCIGRDATVSRMLSSAGFAESERDGPQSATLVAGCFEATCALQLWPSGTALLKVRCPVACATDASESWLASTSLCEGVVSWLPNSAVIDLVFGILHARRSAASRPSRTWRAMSASRWAFEAARDKRSSLACRARCERRVAATPHNTELRL
mmetsp:Transcript_28632/g.72421  ORF Transcript_28632/g.72421 Transcript_28632/m.72421 type:complete len:258 (-) Transcript_28632:907-1680(-)